MSVFDRIVDTLKNQSIEFDLLTHEPVHTSQEAAAVRGSELDQGAKALLCIADGTPVLLVVPGSQKVDTRRFKQAFGFKNLRFATTDEVLAITSVAVGAVPPFGSAMQVQTYTDQSLSHNEYIAFNPGLHTRTIVMTYADFIQVENPLLGDFIRL